MSGSTPPVQLRAWRAYYGGFWRVFSAIESDLTAAGLPSLSWYDALYELYLAPKRQLRMSELAKSALVSRSALTRLVDKLEQAGCIRRRPCPEDGRVQHAELTEQGVDVLRKIWPVYRAGIFTHFAQALTPSEAADLERLLAKLGASAEPPRPRPTRADSGLK